MTKPLYGPSLFQARKTDHVHRRSHLHDRKSFNSRHVRSHAEYHKRLEELAALDPRGSTITEVVQTISVVQVVDGSGATIEVQTKTGSSQTDLIDGETGSTIAIAFKDVSTPEASTGATMTDAGTTTTLSSESATPTAISSADPVSVPAESTTSATDSVVPTTPATDSATTPLPSDLAFTSESPSSTFSSLVSASNSTTSTLTPISSTISSLFPTSLTTTDFSDFAGATTLSAGAPSTTLLSSTLTSASDFSSSSLFPLSSSSGASSDFPTFSDSASATPSVGGDGSGAGTATATASGGTSSSTAGTSESSGNGTSTQTREVVGGVFGGIAGVALLVGLAFLILRMKKRGWCHLRLGGGEDDDGPAAASRALPASGGGNGDAAAAAAGGDGSGAYGTMQQTRPQSAVAASLAALAGKRTSRERAGSGPEMAERGFVRVSGRKLPPVLQYGGDGYTDPRADRDSQVSDASVYRDSMAIFDQPNHTRLALGSPMRPESGIMTMQPGPAKTPVTAQVPQIIDSPSLPRSSTFPLTDEAGRTLAAENPSRDAVGRTLAAHDYSRDGSASRASHTSRGSGRFTEHVS